MVRLANHSRRLQKRRRVAPQGRPFIVWWRRRECSRLRRSSLPSVGIAVAWAPTPATRARSRSLSNPRPLTFRSEVSRKAAGRWRGSRLPKACVFLRSGPLARGGRRHPGRQGSPKVIRPGTYADFPPVDSQISREPMQIFPALTASLAGNILDSRAGVNPSHTEVKEAHREQEVGARFMKTKAVRTVRHGFDDRCGRRSTGAPPLRWRMT